MRLIDDIDEFVSNFFRRPQVCQFNYCYELSTLNKVYFTLPSPCREANYDSRSFSEGHYHCICRAGS